MNEQTKTPESATAPQSNLTIPLAIIIAGALIAGAVYVSNRGDIGGGTPKPEATAKDIGGLGSVNPVTSADHIRGNPNAPVKIVEYSDFECPFCKRFHPTMGQVMNEYGKNGKVAWVYRHFPVDALHPIKARKEAAASECANELGGNVTFWKYADRLFDNVSSNNKTDIDAVLPQTALEIGLDVQKFNACLASNKYDAHVQNDLDNAIATGGNGTPWSIVVAKSGKKYPLSGAQPYDSVKQLIELALQEK